MTGAAQRSFESFSQQSLLDELRGNVFRVVPPLKGAAGSQSVRDYLAPMHRWKADEDTFPLAKRCKEVIAEQVAFYFGDKAAVQTIEQLEQSACMETGTHLSFPRDRDYASRDVTVDNTMVWQGVVLSALSYQAAGLPYHVGPYAGNIPLRNTNGPLYFQFGRTNFLVPLITGKKDRGIAALTPALTEQDFDHIKEEVKKAIFKERLDEMRPVLEGISGEGDDRINPWKGFINAGKGYTEKNAGTLDYIAKVLGNEYGAQFNNYDSDLDRLNNLTRVMLDVVHRGQNQGRPVTFADQAIVAQKYLMDEIMPEGMEQMTWDFSQVTRQLMIEAFRDPNSTFYKIFADPELRDRFAQKLGNIRTGWAYNDEKKESPFLAVRSSKGVAKTDKVPYDTLLNFRPEQIADALEADKAFPTIGLEVAFNFSECGIAAHGGMFQCQYASQYANSMADILTEMGMDDRARTLRSMPLNIATQSLAFAVVPDRDGDRLARYSDFLKNPKITREQAKAILDMPVKDALTLGAPSLLCFLNNEDHLDQALQSAAIIEAKANGGAHVIVETQENNKGRSRLPKPKR